MRLLGPWNWWAPGPLGRIADRVGFSHVEDDDPERPSGSAAPGTPERQGSSAGTPERQSSSIGSEPR
jgi:hypothetical protein